MNNVSRIKTLYAYEDGDTITPKMGVQIAVGHGLQQFYNAETLTVTNTNFNETNGTPPTLFPQAYSSKVGAVIIPDAGGQWYFNNPENSEMAILDSNGSVKTSMLFEKDGTIIRFSDIFEATTVTTGVSPNTKIFPALKIKDNLVNSISRISTDIHIYFKGTYGGKQFTCEQRIPVQSVVGDAYQLLVSVQGPNGVAGDEVLSDDNDYILYTAALQMMSTGTSIDAAVISFEHFDNGVWNTISDSNIGIIEYSSQNKTLKLFEAAVDGSELFRAKAEYNGNTWYQLLNPTDEHDPYYIVDGCSVDGDIVKRGDIVTFNPKIYKRKYGPGEEDECVYEYSKRNDSPATNTEQWNLNFTLVSQKTGDTIQDFDQTGITFEQLQAHGGISTRIQASRA